MFIYSTKPPPPRKPVDLTVACNTKSTVVLLSTSQEPTPLSLWNVTIMLQKEEPQCSVQGATYHGPGFADGHQASEEVFIMQLAENMGVIGYHNGDFFHHLASCCSLQLQTRLSREKLLRQLSASAHTHLRSRG